MPQSLRALFYAYGIAVLSAAVALIVRWRAAPLLAGQESLTIFVAATVVSAWWGGFGPAVLTTALNLLAILYFFMEPEDALIPVLTGDHVKIGLFLFASFTIALLGRGTRAAQRRIEQNVEEARLRRQELEDEVASHQQTQQNLLAAMTETQRRVGEAEEAQRLLKAFLEYVPEGVSITGGPPDFPIIILSKHGQNLVGKPADRLLGMRAGDNALPYGLFLADGVTRPAPQQMPLYRATHHGEEVRDEQMVLQREDGTRLVIQANAVPIRDALGKITGALNCWKDITEQKRAMDALRQSETRERAHAEDLETVLRTTPTPIWISYDAQCREIIGNPAAFELLNMPENSNMSVNALQGTATRNFRALRDGLPVASDDLLMRTAVATNREVLGVELMLEFNDGESKYIYGNAVPLRHPDGSVRGAIAAFMDISAHKLAEQEIAALYRELSLADRRKDEFLATLAHELRNPLAPIRNALQIMQMKSDDAQGMGEARQMIERQVQQMVRLIDDLLDVSRITRGKIDLRLKRIDLAAAVNLAIETCAPAIEAAGHQLSVRLPAEPLYLDADLTRLAQVLANLLNNAVKFTEPGGRITVSAAQQADYAVVRVRDTGRGIAAHLLPHIFEMFVQGDYAAPTEQPAPPGVTIASAAQQAAANMGGLGVGLGLVRGLITMHGGTAAAHSDGPGKGSEFIVTLPLAERGEGKDGGPQAALTEAPGVEELPGSAASRRILVVDDNLDSANSLATLLRLMGNNVRATHDPWIALGMAAEYRPEMLFLDIGLPEISGYELARKVREVPGLDQAVLVAVTGWGREEDRVASREAGFDHHLVKPLDPEALKQLLIQPKLQ